MEQGQSTGSGSFLQSLRERVFGRPKDIHDPSIFHKIALIPALAWIGLGADGLSSSSYGPEEAFRALGQHTYLAFFIALATALTVFVISYAYTRIIEHFPAGGGGYVVATNTLGEKAGVVSGSALIVDYVLTIATSVASCGDAIFSYLPLPWQAVKVGFEVFLVAVLILMNIRGVKESVTVLAPIFVIFVLTHIYLIGFGVLSHIPNAALLNEQIHNQLNTDLHALGWLMVLKMFLHAYSIGGGTYTGIEAVSNGLQIMKEPRVQTAKRTMLYLSTSLALTAGGILLLYLLFDVKPEEGRTLNSLVADAIFGQSGWRHGLAWLTIFSEGALLFVAAQAGFIDAPRVMANMAVDMWLPRKFSSLSERLTMRNGVLLVGFSAIAILFYTKGAISLLIVMYSINVFLTFSLSQLGMCRFFVRNRSADRRWFLHLPIHAFGFLLCATILLITSVNKFADGGWMTIVITTVLVVFCYLIRRHYEKVRKALKILNDEIRNRELPEKKYNSNYADRKARTAVQLVSGYNGFGLQTFTSIMKNFPHMYKNVVFASVAIVDSGAFKGGQEVSNLEKQTEEALKQYVEYARKHGLTAEYRMIVGTDVTELATKVCQEACGEFKNSVVFAGYLSFQVERFYHAFLHNNTSHVVQRRLQTAGITTVILPICVSL